MIALDDLAEIYGDKGTNNKWSQLGVKNAGCPSDDIIRVSRQNNSGTYVYFREAVLGKAREYKQGSIDQSGSKDVVTLVGRTPCAIGYSGMAYATPDVKTITLSKKKGAPAIAPTTATAMDKTYPLARALYLYTRGEPASDSSPIKKYTPTCCASGVLMNSPNSLRGTSMTRTMRVVISAMRMPRGSPAGR